MKKYPIIAAWTSIITSIVFVILLLSLHALEPEFDPSWRFISEYMLGSFGLVMHLAFLALAISLGSAAIAVWPQVRRWYGYIGLAVLGIAAIGILIAAIFTTDPVTTNRQAAQTATFSGQMHVFGASLDFTPVAALILSFALTRNQAWKSARVWLWVTAGITFVAMIAFMLNLPVDGKIGPGVLAGLYGRFLVLSYPLWLLTVAIGVLKRQTSQESAKDVQ